MAFFFDEDEWIPIPRDWASNIVRGRTYDTASDTGDALWQAVEDRLVTRQRAAAVEEPRFGEAYLEKSPAWAGGISHARDRRLSPAMRSDRGSAAFRLSKTAHIRAHAAEGPNRTRNGLLLRADIHRLFDDGYVTVDPDLRFVVSPRLHEEFENGRVYYALDGRLLTNVPDRLPDRPGREFLEWHNSEVYLG